MVLKLIEKLKIVLKNPTLPSPTLPNMFGVVNYWYFPVQCARLLNEWKGMSTLSRQLLETIFHFLLKCM